MFNRLKGYLQRKAIKWTVIATSIVLAIMLLLAAGSSIGGSFVSLLLSFQQQTCDQKQDESSGNLAVSGYSKNVISKAIAVAEAVGADLHIKPALVFAQLAAETGMIDNEVVRKDNNFGGVKYNSSFSDIATPGTVSDDGDHYAHFKSISGFATIYRNTIKNMIGNKKVDSWTDFVYTIKAKGYMRDSAEHYISLGKTWYTNYNSYAKKYGGSKINVSTSNNGSSTTDNTANDGSSICPDTNESSYSGTWTWPFTTIKNDEPQGLDGGEYGHTSYPRGSTNFHDGFDFSNGLNGVHNGSAVVAVTSGTIYKVGYDSAALYYVWEKAGDYNIIYQEGFSKNSISVKQGDKVKIGQKIGTLSGSHVHLGITTNKKNPAMNKTKSPVANGFDHPDCWLNPLKVIKSGLKMK